MSRRLYFDMETSFNIVATFQIGRKMFIGPESIIKERAVICIAYKWENDPRVYTFHWDNNQCDKAMLAKFVKVAEQADELVAHNGDRFDIRWLRTRCLFHRIPCMPDFVSIDTLKLARAGFNFNSNKLDYIGGYLGVGRKMDAVGIEAWKTVILKNDRKALSHMVAYCQQDVELLQRVHTELIPYTKHKTHRAALHGGERVDCPECGSVNSRINQNRISGAGVQYLQLQCNDCGKYHNVPKVAFDRVTKERKDVVAKAKERIETAAKVSRALNENKRR
jgi:DNA polymerase elongation subunit (family B)